jgi:hypothetical protein
MGGGADGEYVSEGAGDEGFTRAWRVQILIRDVSFSAGGGGDSAGAGEAKSRTGGESTTIHVPA